MAKVKYQQVILDKKVVNERQSMKNQKELSKSTGNMEYMFASIKLKTQNPIINKFNLEFSINVRFEGMAILLALTADFTNSYNIHKPLYVFLL